MRTKSWLDPFLLRVGATAPAFSLPDADRTSHDLGALLRGRRGLLLDFFYLDCLPCVEGFARLAQLQSRHASGGLAVAAISRGDPPEALRRFAAGHPGGITWLAAHEDDPVFLAYRVWAYPTAYLVDAAGRIAWRRAGASIGALTAALTQLGIGA